ncbi:hypothetical protein DB459_16315 [Bradyrhizobium sp. WD16]|nr:hypothetical protein DB459_16315 [Bradyrhizobium sp. WD16]
MRRRQRLECLFLDGGVILDGLKPLLNLGIGDQRGFVLFGPLHRRLAKNARNIEAKPPHPAGSDDLVTSRSFRLPQG